MPAKKQDLTIEQGTDWAHGWRVTVNGVAIDDTWVARAQIRSKYGNLLHQIAAEVKADGAVVIAVTPADSIAWKWSDGYYDVEIVNADESLTLRVAKGRMILDKEMTR